MLATLFSALHLLALGIGLGAIGWRARSLRALVADPRAVRPVLMADNLWGIAALLWIGSGLTRLLAGLDKGTDVALRPRVRSRGVAHDHLDPVAGIATSWRCSGHAPGTPLLSLQRDAGGPRRADGLRRGSYGSRTMAPVLSRMVRTSSAQPQRTRVRTAKAILKDPAAACRGAGVERPFGPCDRRRGTRKS